MEKRLAYASGLEDFGETGKVVYAGVEGCDGGVEEGHCFAEGGDAAFEGVCHGWSIFRLLKPFVTYESYAEVEFGFQSRSNN